MDCGLLADRLCPWKLAAKVQRQREPLQRLQVLHVSRCSWVCTLCQPRCPQAGNQEDRRQLVWWLARITCPTNQHPMTGPAMRQVYRPGSEAQVCKAASIANLAHKLTSLVCLHRQLRHLPRSQKEDQLHCLRHKAQWCTEQPKDCSLN